jgi:hypothetical protein
MHETKKRWIKKFYFIEVDRVVLLALFLKTWAMFAGLITTLMISSYFTSELQGYYYTFIAVQSLQVFAELGLGTVLSTYASHEWAKLRFNEKGRVIGDKNALSRLNSLGKFAVRWYLMAGLVGSLVLTLGGFIFFGLTKWENLSVWGWPWIMLCLITGVNFCFIPIWSLLEGCNQLSNIYLYKLIQSVASSIAAWVGIFLGAELWVSFFVTLIALLAMCLTVMPKYAGFIFDIFFGSFKGASLKWRDEILPMQWRVSVSWISGYLTFSLLTPVLFYYQGSEIAGQMGMTLAFVNALFAFASSWITPKAPIFGILIADRNYVDLDKMFRRITLTIACVSTVGALLIWSLAYTINLVNISLASRLLSLTAIAYLLLANLILVLSMPMSIYLRAHKKEPLMVLSIVSGIVMAVVVVVTARFYSVEAVALGYLIVVTITTPFVAFVWNHCRIKWHVNEQVVET